METSDNNASESPAPRRSGRARVAPQKFSPEPRPSQNDHAAPSKRKRGQDHDDDDDGDAENDNDNENEGPDASDEDAPTEDEHDDDDADADDEPPRRSKKSGQKSRSKKPAAKRAKVNGTAPAATPSLLAVPAVRLPNRPKKTTKVAPASLARRDDNDLYCEAYTHYWRLVLPRPLLTLS